MSEQLTKIQEKEVSHKKIGLALGGGAAKGLAHIGVLKALQQAQIPIDYLAGSSMGALVGGWFALNKSVHLLEGLFLQIKDEEVFSEEEAIEKKDGALFKNHTIVKFIEKAFKDKSFNDCQIPFAAVATDVETGEQIVLKEGQLSDAIKASIAIPIIFKPVKINSRLLCDGCLTNPVPADIVKKMGADFVIASDVSSRWLNPEEELKKPKDFYVMFYEIFSSFSYQISKRVLENADLVLRPPVLTFSSTAFNQTKEIAARGYQEAKKYLNQIREKTGLQKGPETFFEKFINFLIYDED